MLPTLIDRVCDDKDFTHHDNLGYGGVLSVCFESFIKRVDDFGSAQR